MCIRDRCVQGGQELARLPKHLGVSRVCRVEHQFPGQEPRHEQLRPDIGRNQSRCPTRRHPGAKPLAVRADFAGNVMIALATSLDDEALLAVRHLEHGGRNQPPPDVYKRQG